MQGTEFFVILDHFLPFNNLKNQNFEIMKKLPGDIIILYRRTINDNHDVWFLKYQAWRTELLVILDHFLPFYPPNNPTNQNFEKMKRHLEIWLFYMCSINDNRMMYGSWDIGRNGQNFLSFWTIFCPFIFPLIRKFKILKKWKKHLKILFYTCVP